VDALIAQDWSPEQISSRLYDEQEISISHEWIYNHTYKDKRQGGYLHKHLRCQKQRRKRYDKQDRRGRISPTVSALKNAQLSSTVNPASATGKAIRL
jgi:transposase, IS30 family